MEEIAYGYPYSSSPDMLYPETHLNPYDPAQNSNIL